MRRGGAPRGLVPPALPDPSGTTPVGHRPPVRTRPAPRGSATARPSGPVRHHAGQPSPARPDPSGGLWDLSWRMPVSRGPMALGIASAAAAGDAVRCRHRGPGGHGQPKPGDGQEIAVRHGPARRHVRLVPRRFRAVRGWLDVMAPRSPQGGHRVGHQAGSREGGRREGGAPDRSSPSHRTATATAPSRTSRSHNRQTPPAAAEHRWDPPAPHRRDPPAPHRRDLSLRTRRRCHP